MPRLILATRNAHKTAEIATMLAGVFEVTDLHGQPDAPEVEETGETFADNAALKALAISRFAGEDATDADNNALLLEKLAALPASMPTARFRCVLALARDGDLIATFDGAVEGRILPAVHGGGGFGYDPLFLPDGHDRSFGELPAEAKNAISHRSRALAKFRAWIADHPLDGL